MNFGKPIKLGDYAILWIEQEQSICIKLIDSDSDPSELTADQADELGKTLITLSQKIKQSE